MERAVSLGLTCEQLALLEQLKERMNNTVCSQESWRSDWEDFSDFWIAKFLRARKWVVEDACQMLIAHLQWRRSFAGGIETITEERVRSALHSGVYCYRHLDAQNRVIEWVRVKLYDKHTRDLELMQMMIVYNSEFGRRFMSPAVQYRTSVFDCTGVGLKQIDMTMGRFIAEMGEKNYPDTMGMLVVYNAPFCFWASWALFKPFIDPVTVSKIHFVNDLASLEKHIPRSKIPTWLGGDDHYKFEYAYLSPQDSAMVKHPALRAGRDS